MNKMKEYRKRLNITQEELSAETGLPRSVIARAEAGKNINLSTASIIAEALGGTVDDIFLSQVSNALNAGV